MREIIFENPFILASAPPTRTCEMIARAFEMGWGGAVTKTITINHQEIKNTNPRFSAYRDGNNLIGMKNIELISDLSVEEWTEGIKGLKKRFPAKIIIASLMADNIADWQTLADKLSYADVFELNFGCPHGMPERGMGSVFSEVPELCTSVIKAIKGVSDVPIWAKLSPNITDIKSLAKKCLEAGAEGICAINTVKSFAGIDIDTLKPKLNAGGKSTYGGMSGKTIKPLALKAVAEIASLENNPYISASGGISNAEDAIEFMLMGASNVQICTEVMFKGYGIIDELKSNLKNYMQKHGYSSVDEFIGNGLGVISNFEELDKTAKYIPKIDKQKCKNCQRCYVSCRDAGFQAIDFHAERVFINMKKCNGCGLCALVCPEGAIT